jgi:type II secretory pathway pseudopilin PulG
MGLRIRAGDERESGFTLAGVLVILSVMLIFLAYTVPRQWSAIMQRERERQTIYAMQQYARACLEFQRKNNTYPVSPSQLKEARSPRIIRGVKSELIDPLTGEVDWLVITQAAAASIPANNGPNGPGPLPGPVTTDTSRNSQLPQSPTPTPQTPTNPQTGTSPQSAGALPGIPIKDYAGGPFVGVRPPISGKAILSLNGNETYETWSYTALDLNNDIAKRMAGLAQVFK